MTTYSGVIVQGPIAIDDAYITTKNTVVNGNVLSNDHTNASLNDEPIVTADLVDDVESGVLTFNGDGTFSYTPAHDFTGEVTFTYTVPFKGFAVEMQTSNEATVTITVNEPAPTPLNPETDANGDGILDSEQPNVTHFDSQTTGNLVALAVDDQCTVEEASMVAETGNNVNDSGFNYPVGLMNFTVDCGDEGYTTTVTQYYYDAPSEDFVVRKHNPNTNAYFTIEGANVETQTIYGQSVVVASYQVTDGGDLDIDGTRNGIIVDPAGLALAAVGSPNTGLGGKLAK